MDEEVIAVADLASDQLDRHDPEHEEHKQRDHHLAVCFDVRMWGLGFWVVAGTISWTAIIPHTNDAIITWRFAVVRLVVGVKGSGVRFLWVIFGGEGFEA